MLTIVATACGGAGSGEGAARLSLVVEGDGRGAIRSAPAGLECGESCEGVFPPGGEVTLSATPASGSTFAGFTGDCTAESQTCTVLLDHSEEVHARFVSGGGLVWARRFGAESTDRGFGVVADPDGNVVATGYFDSMKSDFGGGSLVNQGGDDVVVAKYRGNDGSHVWSTSFGGPLDDRGLAVAVDKRGDVFVTGYFQDTITFASTRLVSEGNRDIFVAKLSGKDGSVAWAKSFGTEQSDQGMALTVSLDGNPIVTGFFLGTLTAGKKTLVTNGNRDVLLAELESSDGHVVWARSYGGGDDDQGLGLAIDKKGNVLATGFFSETVRFGSTELRTHGAQDLWVGKFRAADGSAIWATGAGDVDADAGLSVAGTDDGNVVVTGYFEGDVELGSARLSSAGAEDALVAKLDGANGAPLWTRRFGGVGPDQGLGVAAGAAGEVVVTGFFNDAVDLGTGPLTHAGGQDIFVARLDGGSGVTRWARSFGGTGEDLGLAVSLDASGFPFVTGWFDDATQVGGEKLDKPLLRDLIVFRLGP